MIVVTNRIKVKKGAWRNSDAFKSAHKRPEPGSEAANKESPVLGSEIITYEVASVKNR
ncbi:hypothetical protein [Paenibacillus graminis]|uniref:hypothetical protein n=1 Tax=Paenibacillus graminis TaxID=189425 RepID=UPI002DB9DDBB|nr:hypothetical protein [Paenibacillus graminis]MEC0168391.1 hypothetical protein [Paenibacillus graminis]